MTSDRPLMPSLTQRESQTCDLGKFLPSHQGGLGQSLAGLIWKERKCGHMRSILSLGPRMPDRGRLDYSGGNISVLCPHVQVALDHTPFPQIKELPAPRLAMRPPTPLLTSGLLPGSRGPHTPCSCCHRGKEQPQMPVAEMTAGRGQRLQLSRCAGSKDGKGLYCGHLACPAPTEGPRRIRSALVPTLGIWYP